MNCHWVKASDVPGGKFHVPGCMGAAVYGPSGCTCQRKSRAEEREDMRAKIKALEKRIEKLEKSAVTAA